MDWTIFKEILIYCPMGTLNAWQIRSFRQKFPFARQNKEARSTPTPEFRQKSKPGHIGKSRPMWSTSVFGLRILQPYAPLRAERSASVVCVADMSGRLEANTVILPILSGRPEASTLFRALPVSS
ncbi:MAG: hypothetical protein Q4F28_03650 [Eubacteriales bacterium]|nr:hypothetical protein [Eubacteriales bacterium]